MSLDLDRIRAICFDVDGTLRDTDDEFVQRLARLLSPLAFINRTLFPWKLARRIVLATENPGNSLLVLTDRLGIDGALNQIGDWIYRLGSARSKHPPPLVAGTREALVHLQLRFPLSVVSSRGARVTMEFLNQHQLGSFFHFIATGQTSRHAKPWPDSIYRAAEEMKVSPQACLMVGDTPVDIRAGRACGAQTVGVLCGFGEEDELRASGADLILPSPVDLIPIFR